LTKKKGAPTDAPSPTPPPPQPARFHKIRSLEVRGGFLNDLKVDFDPHLNCLIGGRGTGKTTILEFLRFALKDPTDPARRMTPEVKRLVAGNLKTGHVRVGIETKDGARYTVVRGATGETSILDEAGKPTNLSLTHGAVFDIDVFSAHEIEGIATTPAAQLEILDRFEQEPLRLLAHDLKRLEQELSSNALELVRLGGERAALQEVLVELPLLEERLRALQGTARTEQVETALARRRLAELEAREVRLKLTLVDERLQRLAQLPWLETNQFAAEVAKGPHGEAFTRATAALDEAERVFKEATQRATAAVGVALAQLEALKATLDHAHQAEEEHYRSVLASHERERDKAQEQLLLQRRQVALLEARRRLDDQTRAFDAKLREREGLVEQLSLLREKRTAIRAAVARSLTTRLAPLVQVSIQPGADHARYEELLQEGLRGQNKQYSAVVQRLVKSPPSVFAQLVQARDLDNLVERTGLDRDRVGWVVEQLKDTKLLYDIEVVDLQDAPRIELQDVKEYKDASTLSTGQRCTTILPILLLDSDKPLLIDQPEDNLDGAFIYEHVVKRIQAVKEGRQLLFVTHNPNIPVLGDAELVVVMKSDGKRASVKRSGTVLECQEDVTEILEGGRLAFEERQKRYGYDEHGRLRPKR
jgi:DNA repair exonuclease SbcCD ATPase subunit